MHSSRMRTVRCSGRQWGVCLPRGGVCRGAVCPGGGFPGGVCPEWSAQEGGLPKEDICPVGCPPVDRMTNTCKNITLRNYVAGGKYGNIQLYFLFLMLTFKQLSIEIRKLKMYCFTTCFPNMFKNLPAR